MDSDLTENCSIMHFRHCLPGIPLPEVYLPHHKLKPSGPLSHMEHQPHGFLPKEVNSNPLLHFANRIYRISKGWWEDADGTYPVPTF